MFNRCRWRRGSRASAERPRTRDRASRCSEEEPAGAGSSGCVSTLNRLYEYAKTTGVGALENFTTEALAGTFRHHPRPLLELLRDRGLLAAGEPTTLAVETQFIVAGTGVIDLVIHGVLEGRRFELWCEVKVNAGESGTQLDSYQRHIAGVEVGVRPTLFTLGPRALRDDPAIPHVTWHELRRSIRLDDGPGWADFSEFLREIRMSDDFDQPLLPSETVAFDDFRRLHGKVARTLQLGFAQAAERWPFLPWPTDEKGIRASTLGRLATHEQLAIGVQAAKQVWLLIGVSAQAGDADLFVAVETWPRANDLQRDLIGLADAAGLGAEWSRKYGAWGGLRSACLLAETGDPERAAGWLVERIGELDAAGILPRLMADAGP